MSDTRALISGVFDTPTGQLVGLSNNGGTVFPVVPSDQVKALVSAGAITGPDFLAARTVKSDSLPPVTKPVTATGSVTQSPAVVNKITCTAGAAVGIVLRDSVSQNVGDADTTNLQVINATMNAGEVINGPFEFAFGVHATVSGTGPAFSLEF